MKPMLANKAPADYLALKYPLAAEIKYDGIRCIASVLSGTVKLFSRTGKTFDNFKEVAIKMNKMPEGVYDGEITSTDFQTLLTRVQAESGTKTDVPIEYKIFDKLTFDEWTNGGSIRTYQERCIDAGIGERTIIKDAVELEHYYNYVLKTGKEGLILKALNGNYVGNHSNNWYKLKPKDTLDMQVIGFEESKNEGNLGAFYCSMQHEDGYTVHAYVSGFTKAQKAEFWAKREELIGKTIEVEYQEMTKYSHGTRSLRFPNFTCIRVDK